MVNTSKVQADVRGEFMVWLLGRRATAGIADASASITRRQHKGESLGRKKPPETLSRRRCRGSRIIVHPDRSSLSLENAIVKIPLLSLLSGLCLLVYLAPALAVEEKPPEWPAEVERALERAEGNRAELEKALKIVPPAQRKGMVFLIANMPPRDLRALHAEFLIENVRLAYKARAAFAWGEKIPEDIFLNDVLPYASVDEARDPWRKELYQLCAPLVKDCKTPAEAAHRLNSTIFAKLKVRFSTQRKKPHQSPKETIEQGKATCTGLSILLVDACRSVAVPARLAGTPLWANKRGNHSWVEVWDAGWHFAGAAEPDSKGLDHGWFEQDASEAKKDSTLHAIYATSFRRTKVTFPLVWAPESKDVYAENVTDRYTRTKKAAEDRNRVMIRVWDSGKSKRLALPVLVTDCDKPKQVFRGESRGEGADANDILTFELLRDHEYLLQAGKPVAVEKRFRTTSDERQFLDIEVPAAKKSALSKEQARRIDEAVRMFFAASAQDRAKWRFDAPLDAVLWSNDAEVRQLVWKAYQSAPIHEELKKDFETDQVRYQKHESAYKVRKVGKRPANGWPLVIAMHGGGGAPKEVNDSQWQIMQRYYRDQPTVTGYQYLALRAPNDTWNGFYDDYVPPLIVNLIRQFLLFGDVDPNKVYLIGYSHGGYGAFFIGPKIADRFAAVHSSAAAPTDGTISARTLRNTRFTFMIGETDNAYGRRKRCEAFNEEIQKLKEANKGEFPVEMELKNGFGHGGLPDRDKLKEMYAYTRNPTPRHVTWDLTDSVVSHCFWLSVSKPAKGGTIDAKIRDNRIDITTQKVKAFDLDLDSRLIDFGKPLRMVLNGKEQERTIRPSLRTLCQSLLQRGDPELAFTCHIPLEVREK
jgi:transglutaminase-like putative cysteine protease/predicted esterase